MKSVSQGSGPLIATKQTSLDCCVGGEACSGDELADTTGGLDALLGDLGELLGSDDGRDLGDLALSEDLEEALLEKRS